MIAKIKSTLTLQTIGEETLVYDSATQKAVCLGKIGSLVLQACLDAKDADALTAQLAEEGVESPALAIEEAVAQFAAEGLLEESAEAGKTFDRRRFLQAAGAAAALPIVMSVAAPRPAQAMSCNNCDAIGMFPALPANCNNCGDNCLAGALCDAGARCCFEYRLIGGGPPAMSGCDSNELLGAYGCRDLTGEIFFQDCGDARDAAIGTGIPNQLYYCCCCAASAPNSCC